MSGKKFDKPFYEHFLRQKGGVANIVMATLYVSGASLSQLNERRPPTHSSERSRVGF